MLPVALVEALREFSNILAKLAAHLGEYGTDLHNRKMGGKELPIEIAKAIVAANLLIKQIESSISMSPSHRIYKKLLDTLLNLTHLISTLTRLANAEEFAQLSNDETPIPPTLLLAIELTTQHLSVEIDYYIKLEKSYMRVLVNEPRAALGYAERPFVELASVKETFGQDVLFSRDYPSTSIDSVLNDELKSELTGEATSKNLLCTFIPVFFATDRAIAKDNKPQHCQFLNRRGKDTLSYGIAEVSIPPIPTHKRGRVERPFSFWKFQFKENEERHIVITSCDIQTVSDWKQIATNKLEEMNSKTALVYIHGFNVTFDDAIRQAAQIGRDIEFRGLVTAYSWSSVFDVLKYAADEDSVKLTAPRLLEFLETLRDIGVTTIHVIAHSMGNRALLEAIEKMPTVEQQETLFGEIVMAAPDIDATLFTESVSKLKGKANRYTLYGSASDKAICVSKKAHAEYPRAGDGGDSILVVDGVETIDATAVGADILGLGHSYFSKKRPVLSDLYYLIRESIPAARRDGLQEKFLGSQKYWLFDPL